MTQALPSLSGRWKLRSSTSDPQFKDAVPLNGSQITNTRAISLALSSNRDIERS